jgi:thioredoxin reductase (NADPH)
MEIFDVIIIGSGPAGLTAAIYTQRANLKTLIVGGRKWGGQLMLTTLVENFPGFPEGIQGPDLMTNMRKQAEHHGAKILDVDFKEADYNSTPIKIKTDEDREYQGKTVIIATGADTKWLDVPGEKEKIGRGVSTCAPCDGAFFRNKNVIVVGGGDSAMEEALVMTKYANEVTLVHRRDSFRASEIMQTRVKENPKIKILLNSAIDEILGENKVEKVKIKNTQTNEITDMPIDGVFVAIGHIPNSTIFKGIETDEKGFIKIKDHTKTNIDRVFVAGDVHDSTYKQAITAAGFGCMAALEVEKYLLEVR